MNPGQFRQKLAVESTVETGYRLRVYVRQDGALAIADGVSTKRIEWLWLNRRRMMVKLQ
jgi:hypothetical protein